MHKSTGNVLKTFHANNPFFAWKREYKFAVRSFHSVCKFYIGTYHLLFAFIIFMLLYCNLYRYYVDCVATLQLAPIHSVFYGCFELPVASSALFYSSRKINLRFLFIFSCRFFIDSARREKLYSSDIFTPFV